MPYQPDLSAAFRELRQGVFAAGDFHNPATWGLQVPETLAEFDELRQSATYGELLRTSGTHSVLDLPGEFVEATAPHTSGTIRPLTPDETRIVFGVDRPTREDYERVGMPDNDMGRWTGCCVILHRDGEPAWIAFWGSSGD